MLILSKLITNFTLKQGGYVTQRYNLTGPLTKLFFNGQHNFSSKDDKTDGITIRSATLNDKDTVMEFVEKYLMAQEPLAVYTNASQLPMQPEFMELLDKQFRSGLSLVVEDKEKRLIGTAINDRVLPSDSEYIRQLAKRCKEEAVRNMLEFIVYAMESVNVWEKYNLSSYFESTYLVIDPNIRNAGLGSKLGEAIKKEAIQKGFRLVRADVSSGYSYSIAEKQGLKCIHVIPYREYLKDGKPVFKNIKEPHTEMRIFVAEL